MKGRPIFFDQSGEPITVELWSGLWELGIDYRRVAHDMVGPFEVSAVWLGLDHGHGFTPTPLIFETMIFNGEECGVYARYATHAEAEHGHRTTVARVLEQVRSQS